MIDPTDLINATREGFALLGLRCMHSTEMIDEDGEVLPVVVVSPVTWGNGIAIQYTKMDYSTPPERIVADIWQAASREGLV